MYSMLFSNLEALIIFYQFLIVFFIEKEIPGFCILSVIICPLIQNSSSVLFVFGDMGISEEYRLVICRLSLYLNLSDISS